MADELTSADVAGLRPSKKPWFFAGCGMLVIVAVAAPYGIYRWYEARAARLEAEAEAGAVAQAKQDFQPALDALGERAPAPVDLDKTIRVIHEVDVAMEQDQSMDDYLSTMAGQDYRNVAPEVLDARRRILELQFALVSKQTEVDDKEAAWEFTSKFLLSTLSVVQVSGNVDVMSPEGSFSVDRKQAQKLLADLQAEQEDRQKLHSEIEALQVQLFEATYDYSTTYYTYVDQWDRLCVLRDRAYLAAHNQDWDTVAVAADAAIAQAPMEKEAHLLKAQALIEGGNPEDLPEAEQLLTKYIEEHPGESAPAFLLMGVAQEKSGDHAQAQLAFQQSAAYYPNQADKLTDMLDPYKMRAYLRKSREGGYILEQYQTMMLGAGYYSPDLQMAKAAFDQDDFYGGKQKVMDHFARRRSQQQWGFILEDIDFAHDLLGPQFHDIFPEDSYLDLQVSPTMFGGETINVAVNNRSDKTLHNATLILAVHFTDMHPADYEPFAAEKTMPAVMAHEVTDFGKIDVSTQLWGVDKGVGDIVQHRAVLLTDEAVLWVDTDEYKIAEAKEFRDARQAERPKPEQQSDWHQQMRQDLWGLENDLNETSTMAVEPKYGFNDDVQISLPKALSAFKPVFTLKYAGQEYKAKTNVIDGDHIVLTFDGVGNFDGAVPPSGDMELVVNSVYGDFVVTWTADGSTKWDFRSTEAG
jgi:tetratricopeptide (TPR) repeat protein